jgi:plastocyanin
MKKRFAFALTVLIFLTGCNLPIAPRGMTRKAVLPDDKNEPVVMINGYAFSIPELTIKAGQTVTWVNQDAVVHTVIAEDGSWASADLSNGASFSHRFATPGKYPYRCGIHYEMQGTVIVEP